MEEEKTNIKESRSSIELKRSTKGVYSWNIKFYFDDVELRAAILEKMNEVDTNLKNGYCSEPEFHEKEDSNGKS